MSHYKPPLQGGDDLTGMFSWSLIPGSPGHVHPKNIIRKHPRFVGFHIAILIASELKSPENTKGKCRDLIQICETKCKNLQMFGI